MDGRCQRCFAQLASTAGNCAECGWPGYDIHHTGCSTIYISRPIPLVTITVPILPEPK